MKSKKTYLTLSNGVSFEGKSSEELTGPFFGEVVFTTGMTGYVESLTDPSYAGQILVFTYPLIGNYGVPPKSTWESSKIHARGVVVNESCANWSHAQSQYSLEEWLREQNVPLITGVDTRALTKMLRSSGTLLGAITASSSPLTMFEDPSQKNMVSEVTISEKRVLSQGKKRVIAVDCGMKENMIRELLHYPLEIVRVPFDYDYSNEAFDGVFLSNGPGDPRQCHQTIAILQKAMLKRKPIFGVCLGCQLLALAAGAETYKLKFGHRGHNQPCQELENGKCYITSQNHGYAVNSTTLPKD